MGQYTTESLLKKGEELLDQCQPELAVKFYEKALAKEPENVSIMDTIGQICLEIGDFERCFQVFASSIKMEPNSNPQKWLNMAQLVNGEEAMGYTEKAIELLLVELELSEHKDNDIVRKHICDAYCSLAELFVTDLCDDELAEQKCEEYLKTAKSFDVGSPELTQSYANLRLIQNNLEDAATFMDETYDRICKLGDDGIPSIEFRIFTGKLLIETEKYQKAADILEGVMLEDDENSELWYLVGKCYSAVGDFSAAFEFYSKCVEALGKLKQLQGNEFQLDAQLLEVEQLLEELVEEPEP